LPDSDNIGPDIQKMLRFGVKFAGIYTDGNYFPETVETLRKNNLKPGSDVRLLTQQNALAFCPKVSCDAIALPMFETGERAACALLSLSKDKAVKRVLHSIQGKIIIRRLK
jgi:DNA-binding LacI/PurR family transcriptional regulator